MSTESERRPYRDGAEENSPTGAERRVESQYGGTEQADRGRQAGPAGETAAARRDPGQTEASRGIGEAEPAQTTGAAPESNTPAAPGSEPARADASRRDVIDSEWSDTGTTGQTAAQGAPSAETAAGGPAPLLPDADLDRLRTQWREVQVTFVDNPKDAVARADELLGDTIHQLTATYDQRKRELDERLGDTSDTEGLRQALRGYRAFFDQLLSIGG